ncbi:MAG: 50S ribosomal protein L32 [Cyanobacteria bacterium SZAS LIN-2]|nr:50S ribosomal protein L32 [Cyanobacteria bacterium SZAS LIN-3]MBS1994889.1 50S ribosomal protein L32 [Cyanobacteria bacterium SZAS LIN-2]MBS2009443.1 50S ribosomal protein L32 [Cyanobacteria bacterium SZAS TMP-1]
MAQPKKKTSHQKQHQRRAHWKASDLTLDTCSNCGAATRRHTACPTCHFYRGRLASRKEANLST